MIHTVNSIDSIIWSANKHGRNSISINPNDTISKEIFDNLKKNGFIVRQEPTMSGKFLYYTINW